MRLFANAFRGWREKRSAKIRGFSRAFLSLSGMPVLSGRIAKPYSLSSGSDLGLTLVKPTIL